MEVDSGDGLAAPSPRAYPPTPVPPQRATLQESRHNTTSNNSSSGGDSSRPNLPSEKTIRGLINTLVGFAGLEEKGAAQAVARELSQACQALRRATAAANDVGSFPSLPNLRKVIAEEVKAAVAEAQKTAPIPASAPAAPTGRTWAAVAGTTATLAQPAVPKKVVPARLSREVLVKAREAPADLAKRTPQEIVQAVNAVSAKKGAVAARRLPSGDIVVTFQDAATKDWHTVPANSGWIQRAFGEQAKESTRTFAVLVKGIHRRDLQGLTEEAFGKELGIQGVERVRFRVPKHEELLWAAALVAFDSQETAKKACDEGVIWRAQIYNCEPYWAALNPVQCYRCWQWGHIQHHCKREALCPRCGTAAHGEGGRAGEELCPTHDGQPPRCPACGGRHPAWARECPAKIKEAERAREAYQHRPRTFEASQQQQQQQPVFSPSLNQLEDDGFQAVGSRKRRAVRGRPTDLARAARDPLQARISFGPEVVFQSATQPAILSATQPALQPVPQITIQPATQPDLMDDLQLTEGL